MDKKAAADIIKEAETEFMDQGLIIEAGFAGLRALAIPEGASKNQVESMRFAFFAGAQHLFACMMSGMDPGEDPTEADMRRMDLINQELDRFASEHLKRYADG